MASYKSTVCSCTTTSTTTTDQPEASTAAATVVEEEFDDVDIKLEDIPDGPIMGQDALPPTNSGPVEVKQEHPPHRNTITIQHPHTHWFLSTAILTANIETQLSFQRRMVDSPLLETESFDRLQPDHVPHFGLLKTLVKTPVGKHYSCPMLPYARVKDLFHRIEHLNKTHVALSTIVDTFAAHCRSRTENGASQWEIAALLGGAETLTDRINSIMMVGYNNDGVTEDD